MKLTRFLRVLLAWLIPLAAAVSPGAFPLPMAGPGTGTVIEAGWTVGERAAIEVDYLHTIAGSFKADWRMEVPATSDREEFSPSLSFGLGGIPAWEGGGVALTFPLWGAFGLSATPYADLPWGGGSSPLGSPPGIGNRFGRLGLRAVVPAARLSDRERERRRPRRRARPGGGAGGGRPAAHPAQLLRAAPSVVALGGSDPPRRLEPLRPTRGSPTGRIRGGVVVAFGF